MLNIANLKPGMIVSVRNDWTFYPRCLVVTTNHPRSGIRFVSLKGNYWVHPFLDGDVVEVVE